MLLTLILLIPALAEVTCAPDLFFGSSHIRRPTIGSKDVRHGIGIDNDGIHLEEQLTQSAESEDVEKEHTNSRLDYKSEDGNHSRNKFTETDETDETDRREQETERRGVSLGLGGISAYDRKTKSKDVTKKNTERDRNSSFSKDKNDKTTHYDASSSEYDKTSIAKDHTEENDDKEFSISKKGGQFIHNQNTKEEHSSSSKEAGSYWKQSGDKNDKTTHYDASSSEYDKTSIAKDHTEENDDKEFSISKKGGQFIHNQNTKEEHSSSSKEAGSYWKQSGEKNQDDSSFSNTVRGNDSESADADNISTNDDSETSDSEVSSDVNYGVLSHHHYKN